MQSPVLINYDPTFDLDGEVEDWEDWSDVDGDFFDQETPKKKRRKLHHRIDGNNPTSKRKNRPKAASIEGLPKISLGKSASSSEDETIRDRSIVKWKVRQNSPELPIFEPGKQEKVSILKDWKERFKSPPPKDEKSKTSPRNGTQRAVAVVIETSGKAPSLPSGSKRKRNLDEPAYKVTTTLSHRNKAPNPLGNVNSRGASAPRTNGPTTSRKRKLSPSPPPAPKPVPKRQSARQSSLVSQHKVTAQAGQKRKARDELEEPEPQTKKAKVSDDAMTKKENVRPKMSDKVASKKENIRPKSSDNAANKKENIRPKPSDSAATKKKNVRPKAAAVGRRSTRRK